MTLHLWLDRQHVGTVARTRAGRLRLTFDPDVVDAQPNAPWLSCSLPVSRQPADATLFLSGLLPEGDHRRRMAELAGVLPHDTYGLLQRFGRDVAGAIIITPDDTPPADRHGDLVPLTDDELAAAVDELPDRVLGIREDSELSLDGMQDKMLLVREGGTWARPVHGRPSTHILKLDDRRFPGLVAAEAACLRLAADVGVTTVDAQVLRFGMHDTIVVSRFDRTEVGGTLVRVHQEDTCQALGKDPNRLGADRKPRGKYQLGGGPSFAEVAGLLRAHAADPDRELARLHRLMVFTVAIGNSDAHGKNVGLLHPTPDTIELAPAYDTVPTVLWPQLPTRAAMYVNGTDQLPAVTGDDLAIEAAHRWRWTTIARAEAATATSLEAIRDAAADLAHEEVAAYVTGRCGQLLGSLDRT